MKLELPIEVVNQILAYLGTRPYQEVFQIIEVIKSEASKVETKKDE